VLERGARPMAEEGMTQGEIAEPFGQTRSWVALGLKRLRAELEPMLQDDRPASVRS
jgi:hypothetical protein